MNMDKFNNFISLNYKKLIRLANKDFIDAPFLEDTLQECIIYFMEKNYIERFDSSKSSLFTYFYNLYRNFIIQSKKNIKYLEDVDDLEIPYILDHYRDIDKELEELDLILEELFNEYPIYKLYYSMLLDNLNGLSYKDLMVKYNINMQTVKNRIFSIKNYIKKKKNINKRSIKVK